MLGERKGTALVTVLITFTVLSILGMAVISIMTGRMKLTVSYENLNGARYAAEAGIEEMKQKLYSRINDTTVQNSINAELQQYIDNHFGEAGYNPAEKYKHLFRQWVFDPYLSAFKGVTTSLVEDKASYTIDDLVYDMENNRVTVTARGSYGKGGWKDSRIISAAFGLSNASRQFTAPGGTISDPVIVPRPPGSGYSFDIICPTFTVEGDFYYPGNIQYIKNDADLTFHGDFGLGGSFNLIQEANQVDISIRGKMEINGSMYIKPNTLKLNILDGLAIREGLAVDGTEMNVTVENGDVYIGGNLDIRNARFKLNIKNGSLYCNGDILLNHNNIEINVSKDIICSKGIKAGGNTSDGMINVNGSIRCNEAITLDMQYQMIVQQNIECGQGITFNRDRGKMTIKNGYLLCSSLVLNGSGSKVDIQNGNLLCNGNLRVVWGDAGITVGKDFYLGGTLQLNKPGCLTVKGAVLSTAGINFAPVHPAGVPIAPVSVGLGSDISVLYNNHYVYRYSGGATISSNMGTREHPVIIFCEGNLNISNNVQIYGIIYAKGMVTVSGNTTVYGCVVSDQEIDIYNQNGPVSIIYDSTVINNLQRDYSEVLEYFSGGSSGTETVDVVHGFIVSSWNE